MTSDDSDDEPLSVLASAKKQNAAENKEPTAEIKNEPKFHYEPKRKKRKVAKITQPSPYKRLPLTFNFSKVKSPEPPAIQRPADVWLYLKDFNPNGPYSCLLCSEWFINKAKIVLHYVLNHRKDFCGICRYFVNDRETWNNHVTYHTPWPCSQCVDNFPTEVELRQHLTTAHNLVHCRLCHFRVTDDEAYIVHLRHKHNVTNPANRDSNVLWQYENEDHTKFSCLICSKPNMAVTSYFSHYTSVHHLTLKCFTTYVSGKDLEFRIFGAEVSTDFLNTLTVKKYGYVDLDKQTNEELLQNSEYDSKEFIDIFIPEIKQETLSDGDETKAEENTEKKGRKLNEVVKHYKGTEDFDITQVEIIVLEQSYFDYLRQTLQDINQNNVPQISDINYEKAKVDVAMEIDCEICGTVYQSVQELVSHMHKMHLMKIVPIFNCRVCATTFDSQNELDSHVAEELGDFDDLWICQFCDKEFDNREASRRHLTEHWELMEFDNCFSPHLGFKCKYCPTLFWNETDREIHQVKVHHMNFKEHYYQCQHCLDVYSDKIWFVYHYFEKHQSENTKSFYLFKCSTCCIVLTTFEEMRDHFNNLHPDSKKVFCSLPPCQHRPFSQRKTFQMHLRTQHTDIRKDRPATCNVCNKEFSSYRACSTHAAQVHGPGKIKCKICKQTLHTLDERKLHYLIQHPGHHPFHCNVCGRSFPHKSSLYVHKQEHNTTKQTFTCDYCQKVFQKKDSYREHVQIHLGPRHSCSYCPMRFVQRSNMLRHERRHTGERPYACTHCNATFADKGACNSHIKTHLKQSAFACVYCGQTFAQKSKLTYHTRKHTGENLETCTVCSKMFTSACSLREHMKVHEPKVRENVQCPLCDRKYQNEKYMLRHLRTSHSSGHFICPICKKSLTSQVGLRQHVFTHSPLNIFRCKSCPKSFAVKRTILKHLRKRHNLKSTECNLREFYTKLEPRECQLDLDEDTMNSIFGPPKKIATDVLINNFVTFAKNLHKLAESPSVDEKKETAKPQYADREETSEGDENKSRSDENEEIDQDESTMGDEIEPTDFVSVKIEPINEDSDVEED